MSLQTRFTTVLLEPIQPDELMRIIKDKAPGMADGEAQKWCSAFFGAKRATPTLTTRALWEALKVAPGCSSDPEEIKHFNAVAVAEVQPQPQSDNLAIDGKVLKGTSDFAWCLTVLQKSKL